MSQHQEIISKPAALYKNIGPQDKPKTAAQKSGPEAQKNEQEDAKFQLPPELADLFQDDRNPSADNNPEESKFQSTAETQPSHQHADYGSNNQGSEDDHGDDDNDDGEEYRVDGMHGGSKKIGKMGRMNNKKPQQNLKKKMPMKGNQQPQYGSPDDLTPQMLNKRKMPKTSLMKAVLGAQCYFKTKLCPHLAQNGACNKGERCTYAHSSSELRDQPDLKRTKVCHIFKAGGKCPNGNSCNFAHGEGELRSTPEFYKTAPCQNWAKGGCVHGNKCRFAHGEKELRVVYAFHYPVNFNRNNKFLTQNGNGNQKNNQPQEQPTAQFQNFQQPGMLVPNYTYMAQPITMNPYVQAIPTQVVYQPELYQNQMYVQAGYPVSSVYDPYKFQTTQIPNGQMNFTGQMNQVQYQPMYGYGYPTNGNFTSGANGHPGGNQ